MKLKQARKKLLKNPEFKKEYERFDLKWEIEKRIIDFRIWFNNLVKKGE